jgi:voltage-gated potassium channel
VGRETEVASGAMGELWGRIAAPWVRCRQQLEVLLLPVERRLSTDRWFPHVPLSLIVAPLGLLMLDAVVQSAMGVSAFSLRAEHLVERIESVRLATTHEFAIGLLLLVMSLGLLLRSRFAWALTTAALSVALVVRIFFRTHPFDAIFVSYFAVLLVLLFYKRHFGRRSLVTAACFGLFAVLAFHAYATLATLQMGEHFDPPIREPITALYFAIVTVSTVGYGDITARDPEAQAFVAGLIVIGLFFLATSVSAFLLPLLTSRLGALLGAREGFVDRSRHFVIVGNSPLARNTAEELEKRGRRITFVLDQESDQAFYKQRDVVVGDPTDLSVLRTAGADKARGVLALSIDDAENGFVVLGINELAPTIPTVVALNDPKNQFRLKRTQPSLLLSLQVLGGELLAKALTGEKVESDVLDKVLQLHTSKDEDSAV